MEKSKNYTKIILGLTGTLLLLIVLNIFFYIIQIFTLYTIPKQQRSQAMFTRAIINQKIKRYDDAVEDYTFLIMDNYKLSVVHNQRGVVYFEKGDYKKAIEDFDYVLNSKDSYATCYKYRGLAKIKLGDVKAGKKDLQEYEFNLKLGKQMNNLGKSINTKN